MVLSRPAGLFHATTGYSLYLGAYLAMIIPFTLARLVASALMQQWSSPGE